MNAPTKASVLCAAINLFPGLASASEVRAALGGWHHDIVGTVVDGARTYDFEDDLNIGSKGEFHVEIEWVTPPGWWPDVVLVWSRSDAAGSRFFPGSPPITADRTISADATTGDLDLTLRYPFELGPVRMASGVSLKQLSSDIRIVDSAEAQPTDEQVDEIFPQAHIAMRWPLSENFGLSATLQGVKYQGDTAYDARVGVELWRFDPVLLEAGWQQKRYEVSAGNYALDAKLDGWLLRVRARFAL